MSADQFGTLDLRQLMSFRAVARTGSFHAAADELDYTQSAVSQHVAALEAALAVRLFDRSRGRRQVSLTEAGELLLRHVDAIAARIDAARADMRAYAHGATGVLRVGTYQSVGARLLPAVVGRFAEEWPGIEVRLTESAMDDRLLVGVEAGDLDLAFTHEDPVEVGPFDGVELLRDPFVLVVAASSPLAAMRNGIAAAQVGETGLIAAAACRATEAALAGLRRAGCEPHVVFRSEDNATIQAMARAGLGAALVPLLAVDTGDPGIVVLPTDLPLRRVGLAWHRDRYRTPAARAFVELSSEVGRELQNEVTIERLTGEAGERSRAATASATVAAPGSATASAAGSRNGSARDSAVTRRSDVTPASL